MSGLDLERLGEPIARREASRAPVRDLGPLTVRVAGYLLAHPDAPPSLVAVQVVGRKQDVLRAVHNIRDAAQRFLAAGNQVSENEL